MKIVRIILKIKINQKYKKAAKSYSLVYFQLLSSPSFLLFVDSEFSIFPFQNRSDNSFSPAV